MEARAVMKMVRVSPKKARAVVDQIRGKDVNEALRILRFSPRKAARYVLKTLESAIANAENNHDMDVDSLFIKEIRVDEGPSLKRFHPRARGMVGLMRHRTSHITVVVSDGEEE